MVPPAIDVYEDNLLLLADPGLGTFSLSLLGIGIGILGAIFCVNSRFLGSKGT